MKYFISTVMSKEAGPFPTFPEAFVDFWTRLNELAKQGVGKQVLDWCWISGTFDDGTDVPMLWDMARDFAFHLGLITQKCEFVELAPEVDPSLVQTAFEGARADYLADPDTIEIRDLLAGWTADLQ